MDFSNQVIWITGASSGIGEALAVAFSQVGARLVLSARREGELERVRQRCARPDAHMTLPLDMLDTAAMPGAAEAALARYGRIDILINNAGISQRSLVKETPLDVDERILRVNYLGTVALTKAVLPGMLTQGGGRLVVVSSLVGKIGSPLRSAYAASKHALHGFFDSLRAELYEEGIRVTIVCPGFIRTDVARNALTADGSAQGFTDPGQAQGMDPDDLADRILRAIARNKEEVYIGGREMLAIQAKRFVPGLFNRVMRRVNVR